MADDVVWAIGLGEVAALATFPKTKSAAAEEIVSI
jgi:hypothetical protein